MEDHELRDPSGVAYSLRVTHSPRVRGSEPCRARCGDSPTPRILNLVSPQRLAADRRFAACRKSFGGHEILISACTHVLLGLTQLRRAMAILQVILLATMLSTGTSAQARVKKDCPEPGPTTPGPQGPSIGGPGGPDKFPFSPAGPSTSGPSGAATPSGSSVNDQGNVEINIGGPVVYSSGIFDKFRNVLAGFEPVAGGGPGDPTPDEPGPFPFPTIPVGPDTPPRWTAATHSMQTTFAN